MTAVLNKDGTLAITAMSLVEFLPEIERGFHNGYMLDLEKNEGVPQQFGTMLVLTMFPAGDVQVQDNDEEDEKFVITSETSLAEVIQPAGEEAEKALRVAADDDLLVNALPPVQVVQETLKSAEVVQPVKVDGRRRKG